jgi:hypothetical protein
VYVNDVEVSIVAERVEYLDAAGKLVTESLRDFSREELRKRFGSLDESSNRSLRRRRQRAAACSKPFCTGLSTEHQLTRRTHTPQTVFR